MNCTHLNYVPKPKIVAISGFFTVFHKGHIQYIEEARKLGEYIVIIVNNNEQQIKKKGALIRDCQVTKYILDRMKFISDGFGEVIISIDKDDSVCKTLEKIKPAIFANGGDRNAKNIPEYELCDKLGISMAFGVGGDKVDSSSGIIARIDDIMYERQSRLLRFINKYQYMTDDERRNVACRINTDREGRINLLEPYSWSVCYLEVLNQTALSIKMLEAIDLDEE